MLGAPCLRNHHMLTSHLSVGHPQAQIQFLCEPGTPAPKQQSIPYKSQNSPNHLTRISNKDGIPSTSKTPRPLLISLSDVIEDGTSIPSRYKRKRRAAMTDR